MPTSLLAVAFVVRLAAPLTTLADSLFTKPVMTSLNVGLAVPYTLVALLAVTVSVATSIENVATALAAL